MSATWAVRFPRAQVEEAVRLWPVPKVEACEHAAEEIWFRGKELTDQVNLILRGFLNGERFHVLPDGQLRSPQSRVPQGHLPSGPWISLGDWMQFELPVAALAGTVPERLTLRIVRTASLPQEPDLLLTDAATWRQYALSAPQLRLRPLRFACDTTGRVLVQGRPLPPIPGQRFVLREGVAVPAGWSWQPAVPPRTVRELCRVQGDVFVLFFEDGCWEQIRGSQLVNASRQAVRASTPDIESSGPTT